MKIRIKNTFSCPRNNCRLTLRRRGVSKLDTGGFLKIKIKINLNIYN